MAENLWLRCNAWPAEEASTRQGMPTRAASEKRALADLGIGGPAIGSGHPGRGKIASVQRRPPRQRHLPQRRLAGER